MMIASPFIIVALVWFGVSRLYHSHADRLARARDSVAVRVGGASQGAPAGFSADPVVRDAAPSG